ncbi:1-deoxy-D-xylulose-5-phosphate synthase [bacterium]|nr:1-deoxy-D-xylulose-5-phosphate synthase [bacterium]
MANAVSLPTLEDLRSASFDTLRAWAEVLRRFLTERQPGKTAHLESSLGVLELTLVLHRLLDTPNDVLIWDVGHQCYVHKLLTGRADRFDRLRKLGGPSGFPHPAESPYDAYATGHSGTALSALVGMAAAARIEGTSKKFVAVVGDGALTGGQAMEALNHAGVLGLDLLLVLNDNRFSIDPTSGALNEFGRYDALFDAFNWTYQGPVDGHNLEDLEAVLGKNLGQSGCRVVHITTQRPSLAAPGAPSSDFTSVYARYAVERLERDPRFVLISPAMLGPAGLLPLQERYPHRVFDPGIAEQHAVGLAAGLATGGMRPSVHLYSTFAQRAFDQLVGDVALQNLPVQFLIDRAGITGEDGATHQGAFDVGLLRLIPGIELWDPIDGTALESILRSTEDRSGPIAVRIPRSGLPPHRENTPIDAPAYLDKAPDGQRLWIVLGHAVHWAQPGAHEGLAVVQRIKPLPEAELEVWSRLSTDWMVLEDAASIGGLGEALSGWITGRGLPIRLEMRGIPDRFIAHGSPEELRRLCGMQP